MDSDEHDLRPLIGDPLQPVPAHLQAQLHPARWVVHEWAEYWLQVEVGTVKALRIGSTIVSDTPRGSGNFRVRFENQLGLSTIDVLNHTHGVEHRLYLEVVAPKLGDAESSLSFLRALLAALQQQIATTPFVLSAPTGRKVRDRHATHQPLFDLHFFRTYGATIRAALQTVLGQPHRRLATEETLVLPHQVRQAVLMKVLPKFTGSRARLEQPLQDIWNWAVAPEAHGAPTVEPGKGPAFPRVADKVQMMLAALERDGFVSFG